MTLRLILGLGWALVAGLAGGWLALAPWAVSGQGGGDWTTVTKADVWTGAGLIVLALAGVVVVAVQVVGSLRAAGVLGRRTPARGDVASTSPEMEQALIALAQALAEDLDAQREPVSAARDGDAAAPVRRSIQ
jgi:outer membrane murein-binding lipoprotein Lpp